MAISVERRQELINEYRTHESDTGSPEVQVALLSEEIRELTDHLKTHKHDFSTRRGLLGKVSRRNRLMTYLRRSDVERYIALRDRLGLRR